jgi:hypothetical protein
MHVIGYRRVSTDKQAENGHGLAADRADVRSCSVSAPLPSTSWLEFS